MKGIPDNIAERLRLEEDARREKNWKRWGPYLSERQWGTVREDYSHDGSCWEYLPHDHARSRAYRWGEDGLLGICDRKGRLNFAVALWNGKDPILKERFFGLTGPEGNHGEDVKECYYYLDSTPTHSYMKALYKYPQERFPYEQLVTENAERTHDDDEFELIDAGVFDDGRYFDVFVEYAKAGPEDLLIRIRAVNRGAEPCPLHILPTIWFRNIWSWGREGEGYGPKPNLQIQGESIEVSHHSLGSFLFTANTDANGSTEQLFTDNETNYERLFGEDIGGPYVKDAFHRYLIDEERQAVNPKKTGTKAACHYQKLLQPSEEWLLEFRLSSKDEIPEKPFGEEFDQVFFQRKSEADEFYENAMPEKSSSEEQQIFRQACAGLFWTKQFYYYSVKDWLDGDPAQPDPHSDRRYIRNNEWKHLYNRDVISMPDKWEYPWYAAWDLAFHVLVFARVDSDFAKEQLVLFLREWYMHPNGQLPAYEFAYSDVNPPVHAWACWRVYKMSAAKGERDRHFLKRVFHKLLLNFNWWVNQKDYRGKNLFSGGFLGLDNIGVFDRGQPLEDGHLEQADATAWMAFYCGTMLSIALELADEDSAYEDIASKFFERFVAIVDGINRIGGTGLWDEEDGFYYDQLYREDECIPLKIRSLVGLLPLIGVEVLDQKVIGHLPAFKKRMDWFLLNRPDLGQYVSYGGTGGEKILLSIASRAQLEKIIHYMLDENEFLSPHGVRSLSKFHLENPFILKLDEKEYSISYEPGESHTSMFGGNSNWRGPVWFPVNQLLIEALERYYFFYGDEFKVEYPTGSGNFFNLKEIAHSLAGRLVSLFNSNGSGERPADASERRFASDPNWRDLILFYEHFHGDTGRGLGASHQTGWTALVTLCIEMLCAERGP